MRVFPFAINQGNGQHVLRPSVYGGIEMTLTAWS